MNEDTDLEDVDQPRGIINGEEDLGHPAVGKVNKRCTGTLIGTRTVLTAGHCVNEPPRSNSFTVDGGGAYTGHPFVHPGYDENNHNATWHSDIAIIQLSQEVIGIDPMPLCQAQEQLLTMKVTTVGFGYTGYDSLDFGTKRFIRNEIDHSTRTIIEMNPPNDDPRTCNGDSGGPGLIKTKITDECVLGVFSTLTVGCWSPFSHVRPDGYIDWLNAVAAGDPTLRWVVPCEEVCWTEGADENGEGGIRKCRTDACYWGCEYRRDQPEDDWELVCAWR